MNALKPLLVLLLGAAWSAGTMAAQPLVDVAWIKAHSCDENVRVLDIRNELDGGSKTAYLRGHIPCAVHTDYLKDGWRTLVAGVPGQLPPVDAIAKLIGRLGIDNQSHVVVYHHGKNALDMGSATRVYWTFKVLGHDEVSILDGGYLAYVADERNPVEKGSNKPQPRTFNASLRSQMLVTKDDVAAAMGNSGVSLVDLRPSDQFMGINRHPKAKRNGTIPGARNLPEAWLTENGGGAFRSVERLKQLYAVAEVPTDGEQINFCNTGHWASLGWFVSSELMGNSGARLYDGSMVEWSADPAKPMEARIAIK